MRKTFRTQIRPSRNLSGPPTPAFVRGLKVDTPAADLMNKHLFSEIRRCGLGTDKFLESSRFLRKFPGIGYTDIRILKKRYIESLYLVVGPPLWKIWVRQLGWLEIPKINGKIELMATKPPTRWYIMKFIIRYIMIWWNHDTNHQTTNQLHVSGYLQKSAATDSSTTLPPTLSSTTISVRTGLQLEPWWF